MVEMNSLNERNVLIENNMGLVYMVAKKYLGRGVEFEDLVQIGSMGLIKASERFDPELNVKFSTYAVTLIMGEIKRFFRDDGIIKIPREIKETGLKIVKVAEQMRKELGREPTISELSKHMGIDTERVVDALDAIRPCESIYAENDNKTSVYETLVDSKETNAEIEDGIFLKEMLNSLDVRLRQIVLLRFFKDKTQSEVGKILSISQVQVSRLEKRALEIMKSISGFAI